MRKRQVAIIVLIIFLGFLVNCSRGGEDEGSNATVRLRMPDLGNHKPTSKIVAQAINAPGGWSLTDPSTLSDVLCYGVAVEGPEDFMNQYSCTQVDNTEVMRPTIFGGPAVPGGTVEMDIPSGSSRTFYVFGFAATSEAACLAFSLTGVPPREDLSAPHIIGSETVDLVPGELELDIDISMTGAIKFNECEGEFFNPDPAVIVISDSPGHDFGDKAVGSSTDYTFTLENKGGSQATSLSEIGLATPYSLKDGAWPGTGGDCTTTLGSAQTCTIVVTYAPVAVGTPTDDISVQYDDGYNTVTSDRGLTAIASAPAFLNISDGPTFDFGNQTVITLTAEKTLSVTNIGSYLATSIVPGALSAPFSYKGGSYPGSGGDCGVSLASLATCYLVIEFSPVAAVFSSDTVSFSYIDGANPQANGRAIQGTGANPASLAIDLGPTHDYGTKATGSNTNQIFVVTNSGDVPATSMADAGLTAPFAYEGGTYPGTTGNCGATLAQGATCNIVVTYSPAGVGGHADTIQINYDDGLISTNTTRAIQGTGALPALVSITESDPYDYGSEVIGNNLDYTFTLSNSGGVPATGLGGSGLAAPFTFKGGSFPGTGGTCVNAGSIAAAGTCTIVVNYAPATSGLEPDTIDISYNDGATPQVVSRDVQGTAQNPANLSINGGVMHDYGSETIGNTLDYTMTINNSGEVAATNINDGGALAAPFIFKGGSFPGTGGTCVATGSIAAAGSCTIVVTYTPSGSGLSVEAVDVSYHNGVSVGNLGAVVVRGTGLTPASLSISGSEPHNFGGVTNPATGSQVFVVTNGGQTAATAVNDAGILGGEFMYTGGSYPGTGGNCPVAGSIAAGGGTCNIDVTFAPTAASGPQASSLQINYNDGVGAQNLTRSVQGTGL